MKRTFRYLSIAAFLVVSSVFLLYQNCSRPSPVSFGTDPSSKQAIHFGDANNNGDGYLGKPPVGDYVRTYLNHRCQGNLSTGTHIQGVLKVTTADSTVVEDNCQDYSYTVPFGDPRLDYAPYNPSYLGVNGAIYEESVLRASEPDRVVDVFCRQITSEEGLDIIAKTDARSSVIVRMFAGRREPASWTSRITPAFSVQKTANASQMHYSSSDFELTVDTSNIGALNFPGQVTAIVDGVRINESLSCRVMRRDSAVLDTSPGLVGLWQMNGNFADLSAFNHPTTGTDTNGSLTFQPGHYQQAVDLDGTEDRLVIVPNATLNNLPQITVAAWVWPAADPVNQTHGGIAHKSDRPQSAPLTQGWQFGIGAQTRLLYFTAAFSGRHLYVNGGRDDIVPGTWSHVAFTWDGSPNVTGLRFYVNGVPHPFGAPIDGTGTRVDDSTLPLLLGDFCDYFDPNVKLEGRLDHVGIWNRVLTPAEIQSLHQTGSP